MMEGSDQEGGSSAASMEETSANGELSVIQNSRTFLVVLSFLIGPTYYVVVLYVIRSGGVFHMFI